MECLDVLEKRYNEDRKEFTRYLKDMEGHLPRLEEKNAPKITIDLLSYRIERLKSYLNTTDETWKHYKSLVAIL